MIPFGQTLKSAREAKGLTIEQIADATNMLENMVEDLENEDFSRIVAPIYGRGYVKLYCNAVGINPKPLVDEFMDIYSGNRNCEIKDRPLEAVQEPIPAPEAAPAPAEPKPVATPITASEPEPIASPIPREPEPQPAEPQPTGAEPDPVSAQEPPMSAVPNQVYDPQPDLFAPPPPPPLSRPAPAAPASPLPSEDDSHPFARYSSPMREPSGMTQLNPAIWRWAVIGIIAILILWGVFVALNALHSATTNQPRPDGNEQKAAEVVTTAPAASAMTEAPAKVEHQASPAVPAKPNAPRKQVKVDQLYID